MHKFKIGDNVYWDGFGPAKPGYAVVIGFAEDDPNIVILRNEYGEEFEDCYDNYLNPELLGGVLPVNIIDSFTGEYFFLSNFYEAPVTIDGITYTNSEAAFHSYKCPKRRKEFANLGPKEAKRLGRSVNLRKDWNDIRFYVMFNVCMMKFHQNPKLAKKLLATNKDKLVEGNTWNDTYWGVCNGVGENNLGKILMSIRLVFSCDDRFLYPIPEEPDDNE